MMLRATVHARMVNWPARARSIFDSMAPLKKGEKKRERKKGREVRREVNGRCARRLKMRERIDQRAG